MITFNKIAKIIKNSRNKITPLYIYLNRDDLNILNNQTICFTIRNINYFTLFGLEVRICDNVPNGEVWITDK